MKQRCIVLGFLTVFVWRRFLFPDSPTNAWFLTPDERITAVQRIKARPLNETSLDPFFTTIAGESNRCREQAFQNGAVNT